MANVKRVKLLLCFLLFVFSGYAQGTPEELGKAIFTIFQQDSVDNVVRYIPTLAEMDTMANLIGMDTNGDEFKASKAKYPVVLKEFIETIGYIKADERVRWKTAVLKEVLVRYETSPVDKDSDVKKAVRIAVIRIEFTSGGNPFYLVIPDSFGIGSKWRMGNNIYLNQLPE